MMRRPFTAWLCGGTLAMACGTALPAGETLPSSPTLPSSTQSINSTPSTSGQTTIAIRPATSNPWAPAPGGYPIQPATPIPPATYSQSVVPAYYHAIPQSADQTVQYASLVQQYEQYVKQLPPGQQPAPPPWQVIPVAHTVPSPIAPVMPASIQSELQPLPPPSATTPGEGAKPTPGSTMSDEHRQHDAVAGPPCGDCGKCGHCGCQTGPSGFFWVRADYLLWWTKGNRLPPLVTASPDGTPIAQAGVLGQPGTAILFGDGRVNDEDRSGFRFRAGYWFDCCQCTGIEAEYLDLETDTTSFDAFCVPGLVLGRPFFNVQTGQQDAELICYPGVVNGSVHVQTDSDFQSGGLRLVRNICQREWCIPAHKCSPAVRGGYKFDWLAGYRYLRLDEGLQVSELLVSTNAQGVIPLGTTFDVRDDFQTDSEFHGGELGLAAQWRRSRWTLDALFKCALGNTSNSVTISGVTTTMIPNGPTNVNTGGLLAQATNIGTFDEDTFSAVPEVGVNLGYNITPRLRALVGYTFIYWTDVVRPGDQVDTVLNPSQFPPGTLTGAPRPAFTFNDSDFWAQGLNFGAELRF